MILFCVNTHSYVINMMQQMIIRLVWEVLPDLSPLNCYLFCSMQHMISDSNKFNVSKNWIKRLITSEPGSYFFDGIFSLQVIEIQWSTLTTIIMIWIKDFVKKGWKLTQPYRFTSYVHGCIYKLSLLCISSCLYK